MPMSGIIAIVALVFRRREAIGDHPGGRHLGVFGLSSKAIATDQELIYLEWPFGHTFGVVWAAVLLVE